MIFNTGIDVAQVRNQGDWEFAGADPGGFFGRVFFVKIMTFIC